MSDDKKTDLEKNINKVIEKADENGLMDQLVGKVTSRKLLVWTVASVALFMSQIKSEDWVAISLAYIGSQALVDLASKWRSSGGR
tara:strand:+ start:2993 stop:3247 length:255 start_codon:yes stop_codon:yes gene_type:complete